MTTPFTLSKKPEHFGQKCAKKILHWMPTDTEQNFEMLCQTPEYKRYFEQQGWLDPNAISYCINSEGFRAPEFDATQPNLVALGCSWTVGVGLPLHAVWPSLVSKSLKLACYNLAWGGIAADTCFRLAEYWIPQLKPRLVVMLTPPQDRFELHVVDDNLRQEIFLPQSLSPLARDIEPYLKHYWTNSANGEINRRKNEWALRGLCHALDIPCLIYDCNRYMALSREAVGYARDRMHAGPPAHQILAQDILKDYATIQT